jgi:MYXO-CTERM domain-containing protein
MKTILASASSALLLALGSANGAVTFSIGNYTGSTLGPNGLPIVDAAGAAAGLNTIFGSIGYFTAPLPGGVQSASALLALFVPVDLIGVANATQPGEINGQDYSDAGNAYPANFVGKQGYMVVGNAQNVGTSSSIAIFTLGTFFPAPAGDSSASYTIQLTSNTSSLVFGNLRTVTTQPRIDTIPTNDFVNGVTLLSSGTVVPEPSAALLGAIGALGLLRRRRN